MKKKYQAIVVLVASSVVIGIIIAVISLAIIGCYRSLSLHSSDTSSSPSYESGMTMMDKVRHDSDEVSGVPGMGSDNVSTVFEPQINPDGTMFYVRCALSHHGSLLSQQDAISGMSCDWSHQLTPKDVADITVAR